MAARAMLSDAEQAFTVREEATAAVAAASEKEAVMAARAEAEVELVDLEKEEMFL